MGFLISQGYRSPLPFIYPFTHPHQKSFCSHPLHDLSLPPLQRKNKTTPTPVCFSFCCLLLCSPPPPPPFFCCCLFCFLLKFFFFLPLLFCCFWCCSIPFVYSHPTPIWFASFCVLWYFGGWGEWVGRQIIHYSFLGPVWVGE